MKYIKNFEFYSTETGQLFDYDIGDTVVCVEPKNDLEMTKKYKVVKIYSLAEDKFLAMGNPFMRVDVENIDTGEITKGWKSTYFKLDADFDREIFNI